MSITSLVIGAVSLLCGYTFIVPIIGIVVGVMARRREPGGRSLAAWGIGLSIAAMLIGIVLIVLFGGIMLAGLGISSLSGG